LQPVRRRRLYEEIVEQLEELIVSGELPPGRQLPSERELMEQLKVGRTAIREALFSLQKAGLVTLSNGERATVVAPSPSAMVSELSGAVRYYLSDEAGIRSFQDARLFFEVGLARHAARHASEEDIARLKRVLAENGALVDDRERFPDSDVAFHLVIAEIARNPIFTTLHAALAEWLRGQRSISAKAEGSQKAAYAAHRRIFAAIAARDPERAEREMRAHLAQVTAFYWQAEAVA
jgi:DNA-binding FadR family transcriptional regulator